MQKIALVCLAAIALASCSQKKYGPFTVTGKIAHAPSEQTLYLEKVSFTSTGNVIQDSVKLKADGDYALKGNATEEELYELTLGHQPIGIVINDNNKLGINIDLASSRRPVITGSDATQSLYSFITTFLQRDSTVRLLSAQLDTLAHQQAYDSVTALSLRNRGLKEIKAMDDEIKNVVNTSPNPALVCYAIERARGIDPRGMDSLVNVASRRFKQHSTIAVIKSMVAEAAAQPTQQQGQDATPPYALLNQQAPDLAMNSIDGKTLSIKNFRGKYVLVDFWASWCGPCRAENPNVVAAYNQFKDKNFTILGVSLDNDKASWQEAVKKDGLAWNHMSDLKQWESAAVNTYQFDGIPFNVLIDPSGKIIASTLRGPALQAKLAEVLK